MSGFRFGSVVLFGIYDDNVVDQQLFEGWFSDPELARLKKLALATMAIELFRKFFCPVEEKT